MVEWLVELTRFSNHLMNWTTDPRKGSVPLYTTHIHKGRNPMSTNHINMIMDRLEQMTDQMVIHQNQGNHDMVALLDREARELASQMDGGEEMLTLPQL